MAAYFAFGAEPRHVLSAVIMTAPGTILVSKMLVPETEQPKTAGRVVMSEEEAEKEKQENLLGAIARGTGDGLHMALNIGAMLIAFLALIALLDGILRWHSQRSHIAVVPVEPGEHSWRAVLARGMGHRDSLATIVPSIGNLLGTRMVLNELVAFSHAWAAEGSARSALVHHCDVCACAASPT